MRRIWAVGLAAAWGWLGLAIGARGHDLQPIAVEPAPTANAGVILDTSFEPGQNVPSLKGHKIVNDKAHTGQCSLFAEVTQVNKFVALSVPFKARAGSRRTGCGGMGNEGAADEGVWRFSGGSHIIQ